MSDDLQLLNGVRVVSFTQFLLGPSAVQHLADMGADVIKIEAPGQGAWERTWAGAETFKHGVSVFYLLANRNVRSVTLNLKHPEAQEIARGLVRGADVLVENFRPGIMQRFGLEYEAVREINPGIVYASSSGFGQASPYRDLPGQDLLLQAMSGIAAITGTQGTLPTPAGSAIVDQHGASLMAMAILGALFHRERTGEGQRIEVTMLESALELQVEPVVYHLNGARIERPRTGLGSAFHPAPYGVYETSNGYIALSLSPIKAVAEALRCPEELKPYEDPGLAWEKRDEIRDALDPLLRSRTTDELVTALRERGVWCAPVYEYETLLEDPALKFLEPIMEIEHPRAGNVRLLKHPVHYSGGEPALRRVPPELGQHTAEMLKELGYGATDIERLQNDGVV